KRAEEKLRASEQRFRDVAEAASDWFWEMDENLRFTFFSGRRQELVNLSPKENIGKTRWEAAEANPDTDEKWRNHRATLEAHEAFRDFEYAFPTKDGRIVHNKVSGTPVFDANGVFKGYRGAATDVTEQIEAQAQLIQASKLATLGEMASGIAHELNQPLSVVGMAAELSLMSMDAGAFDTEFVRRKLKNIAGQKERMAGIIDHMRLFSRKDKTRLEPFDPAESVRGAVGLTAKQLEASGIELEATIPAASRNVSGHSLQLEQVVLNLLNNARDAVADAMEPAPSGNGRPAPRVRVSLVDDKRRKAVIISVADTGGGIPEQALGRIFDPFFTTKTEGQGTGLGLSISYSIIDAMGGRLEAQNADGGAVFRITLPVCADRPGAAERRPQARDRKPPTCKPRSHLPRVLFVEDEEAIVEEVADYLRRKGFEVVTAGNAVEALELHASRPADMVITDLLMPGMGGDEFIRRLRQAEPELPIVVVTGHTNFGDEQDIVAEGASAVLQKPISLRELSERLQGMVIR
ncbi:MAG: response regulator, partial [Rhodospirillales bacterium]